MIISLEMMAKVDYNRVVYEANTNGVMRILEGKA
jgi:hypothetical protein